MQELVQEAEPGEREQPAKQQHAGPVRALSRAGEEEPEPDAEQQREDREEALLDEHVEGVRHRQDLTVRAPLHPQHRRDVDEDDPAQGQSAQGVELADPSSTGCGWVGGSGGSRLGGQRSGMPGGARVRRVHMLTLPGTAARMINRSARPDRQNG